MEQSADCDALEKLTILGQEVREGWDDVGLVQDDRSVGGVLGHEEEARKARFYDGLRVDVFHFRRGDFAGLENKGDLRIYSVLAFLWICPVLSKDH